MIKLVLFKPIDFAIKQNNIRNETNTLFGKREVQIEGYKTPHWQSKQWHKAIESKNMLISLFQNKIHTT